MSTLPSYAAMFLTLTFNDLIRATMRQFGVGPVEAVTILVGQLNDALIIVQEDKEVQP
ncbi:hypothetical protein ES703_83617 [subsurface metagenome]